MNRIAVTCARNRPSTDAPDHVRRQRLNHIGRIERSSDKELIAAYRYSWIVRRSPNYRPATPDLLAREPF